MLVRTLEPEVMDTEEEARDYDAMDHSAVNHKFAADFLSHHPPLDNWILDVGTGTAQIPIELCRQSPRIQIEAIDLADHMLTLARSNVEKAGFTDRIRLTKANARGFDYPDSHFIGVVSNSIIHHIPEPRLCFEEMVRVCQPGGYLFVRDLARPETESTLEHLVKTYAGNDNPHQRQLFRQSLHAALNLDEVRALVAKLGFAPATVQLTSDRHWTFVACKA